MNKEDIEKKIEEIEEIIGQIYVDQMVKQDVPLSHTKYKRLNILFKDIYWFLDGLE